MYVRIAGIFCANKYLNVVYAYTISVSVIVYTYVCMIILS